MSPKLPRMTGDEVISLLKDRGFRCLRQKRSHVVLQNNEGRVTVVPLHKGKILGTGILKTILESAGIPEDDVRR